MKRLMLALFALLFSAATQAHAAPTPMPRIVTGTVTCTVPYQVEVSPAGKPLRGRLLFTKSTCLRKLYERFAPRAPRPARSIAWPDRGSSSPF